MVSFSCRDASPRKPMCLRSKAHGEDGHGAESSLEMSLFFFLGEIGELGEIDSPIGLL